MTVIMNVTIPSDAFELGRVFAYEGTLVELMQFVTVGDSILPYV